MLLERTVRCRVLARCAPLALDKMHARCSASLPEPPSTTSPVTGPSLQFQRPLRSARLCGGPCHIDTPIFEGWQQGDALTKLKEDLAKNVPLGQLGDADEIAKAVAFLASDEASYVSGVELFVDGGVAQI